MRSKRKQRQLAKLVPAVVFHPGLALWDIGAELNEEGACQCCCCQPTVCEGCGKGHGPCCGDPLCDRCREDVADGRWCP